LFNLENLAGVALARGEWTEAMTHCEEGLKLCDQAGEPEGRLPFLIVMAGTALGQGNHDLIPAPLAEAGRILQKIEDSDAHLGARLFEAEWAWWLNQTDRALARATEVLARAEAEELPSWTTRGSIARARIAGLAGEHPSITRPWLEAALQLADQTGALPEQIRAHALLAEADVAEARIDEASDHLRRCEQLLLECSARPLFLPFSHALGQYYARRGERELALSALDTARKLAGSMTQLEWMWRFHALCGHQLLALKRFDGAVDQYRSGLVLLEHLASKVPEAERERYMRGPEKLALAEGLRSCHEALVR
jgi:tetratricopeptide (TPR) repeat protein